MRFARLRSVVVVREPTKGRPVKASRCCMRLRRVLVVLIACLGFPGFTLQETESAQQHVDILIRRAMVLDGTGAGAFPADVAVSEGRIVAVGDLRNFDAGITIYATGYYVAPGFIDLHSHSEWGFSNQHLASAINNVTQGITTVVVGQDGRHPWPLGRTLAEQVKLWQRQGVGNNVIPIIGHGSVRTEVMGWSSQSATPEQASAMAVRVREYLRQGAWGISTGLSYAPGRYSSSQELIETTRPVGEGDGVYISHLRNQGAKLIPSLEEMLLIGRETGARVVATHIKSLGRRNWGGAKAAVDVLAQGRRSGVRAYADLYPYTASSDGVDAQLVPWQGLFTETELHSWLPPADIPANAFVDWVYRLDPRLSRFYTRFYLKQQPEAMVRSICTESLLDRLRSPQLYRGKLRELWAKESSRRQLRRTVKSRIDRPGGAKLFVVERHPDGKLVGLNLNQVAQMRSLDVVDTAVQLTLEGAVFTQFHISEEDIVTFIQQPFVAACSDGWIPEHGLGTTHPRSYGAFTRRLRRYVFDLSVIRLPFAVHTATGLPATILGLEDRGYVKTGHWADLIVFDPLRVRDHATFSNPHQYSQGIDWVMINGELVIKEGKPNGARAGRVLLKGRHRAVED